MSSSTLLAIKRKLIILFFIYALSIIFSVGYLLVGEQWFDFNKVESTTLTLTQQLDWQGGEYNNVESDTNPGSLQVLADGTWSKEQLKQPPYAFNYGNSFVSNGDYIYVFVGSGENKFLRYHPISNTWKQLTDVPFSVYYGGEMLVLNGEIYAFPGNYQKKFYKYIIETNTWTELTAPTEYVWQGASLVTDGTDIYASYGNGATDIWFYDVSANSWSLYGRWTSVGMRYGDMVYSNGILYAMNTSNPNRWYSYNIATKVETRMADHPAYNYYDGDFEVVNGYIYTPELNSVDNRLWRYNISSNTWEQLLDTPSLNYNYAGGVVYHQADGYLYLFKNNSYDFWKYDLTNNVYLNVKDAPASINYGADLVKYNSKFYTPRGANTVTFYEYDPSTDIWTAKADLPGAMQYRNGGVAAGSYLYFLRGGDTSFYRYDPAGNSWSSMTNTLANTSHGAMLIYPGSGDYIYATRGGNQVFWRYSISGNSWDDASVADLPSTITVNNGASAVTDNTNLYLIVGDGASHFYKYVFGTNTWSTLTDTPFAPYEGADLVYDGSNKIYAVGGNYNTDFWEYTISTNSWRRLSSTTSHFGYERGPGAGSSLGIDDSGSIYLTQGGYTWVNKYVPSAFNYFASGTWTSSVQDFSYVNSWDSLTLTSTVPSDSSIIVQTRSSTDQITWSDWANVSGTTIASPARRYLQMKVTLTASSDRSQSPVLKDITVTYTGDNTAPTNPSSVVGSSQAVGGVSLTSGQTYSHAHPYFSWSAGSDAQTSVSGYYVYFGNNSSADPQTDGAWQTTTTYTVTQAMVAETYYLKIKTKDSKNNVSSTWNAFTYVFSGVPSEQSLLADETSEFTGTASNVQIINDQIKLASASGGVWLQDRLSLSPAGMGYGAQMMAYVSSSNKLYAFSGQNNTGFYSYDVGTDTWATLAVAPTAVYMGGGVVEGPSGYLYGMPGNRSNIFWRYEIATDTWSDVDAADAPNVFYYGASMVFDGSRYIYVFRGESDDAFWRYDTQNDSWTTLVSANFGQPDYAPTNVVYTGADLTFDGNDTIYAMQGNLNDGFASYSISSGQWTVLPDIPMAPSLGASFSYDSVTNTIYYAPANNREDFYKYDISAQTWTELTNIPLPVYYGADSRVIGDYFYLLRGSASQQLYRYKISTSSWQIPNRGLWGPEFMGSDLNTISAGAALTKGTGNDLYAIRGNYGDEFIKYNTSTGLVTKLANLPSGSYYGASIVYDSTASKVYYSAGIRDRGFFVYDIATDTWSSKDDSPVTLNYGSDLEYDGSQYIYVTTGDGGAGFYRFDTTAGTESQWLARANLPSGVYLGSKLVYQGGYIYANRGYNSNPNGLYRYNPADNTWSDPAVADLSDAVYYGGMLVNGADGYLYLSKGLNTNTFYRYNIVGNAWSSIASAPAQYTYGADGVSDGTKIYSLAGGGTNTYNDAIYTYVQLTSSTSFVTSGTYTSPTHDLTNVYEFSNLRLTYTAVSGTSLTITTRTSADNSTWSSWTQVSQAKNVGTAYEYKINSPANRYIQVKFTMVSDDGVYSSTIDDYAIEYIQDVVDPTNPSTLNSFSSATQSAQIVTNTWYPHTGPNFDWPDAGDLGGAADTATGSGVVGYYVYFGTSSSADPAEVGSYITTSSYTASSMTSGNTYYLRIKAKDNAGNITDTAWQPFIYKFDNVLPTVPTGLAADPSGYSATNSFNFDWDASSDSHSGSIQYCYKTGASSGNYASDQCTSNLTILAIPSHKSGANTFYLRSKDLAGNYSEYVTASYYYSSGAPSAPANLSVTPADSTTNSFAFSWNEPTFYYGAAANLTYYYSVNALPTASSVSSTKLKSLTAGPYATLPGENTFYVVAKDEAGNIDYSDYSSVTFTANTTAPGAPVNIDIADVSVKSTSSWKLAVSWEAPAASGAGVATYKVYRSTDAESYSLLASTGGISYVDTSLIQQVYYYKVKACDSANNCGIYSDAVSLLPDGKYTVAAPLSGDPVVSGITTKKAKISWSTARTADSKVAYGVASGDYYAEEIGSSDQVTDHGVTLTNLAPGTKYYFLARWTDEDGNLGKSTEDTFTTDPAPNVKEAAAKLTSIDNTLIEFTSSGATKVKIYYGISTAFGGIKEVYTATSESTYTVSLEGLEDGTKYYYKINTFDSDGAEYEGDINSFQTLPRPKITSVKIQQVKGTAQPTVLVTWLTNTEISSIVTYYPENDPTAAKDEVNVALQTDQHRMIVRGLIPATDYSFSIKGRDKVGNEAEAEKKQLKTAVDTRPPQIVNLKIESSNIKGSSGNDFVSQLVVSWTTDEPATSQVEFGEGTGTSYSQKTQEDSNLKLNHLVIISNLTPSKVYHLRAVARDSKENIGNSIDTVSITPKATDNALNLVVSNLKLVFGFLNQVQ